MMDSAVAVSTNSVVIVVVSSVANVLFLITLFLNREEFSLSEKILNDFTYKSWLF